MNRDSYKTLPPPGTPMTTDDFLALPETLTRIELIDGVVVYPFGYPGDDITMSPSPHLAHQETVGNAYFLLKLLKRGRVWVAPMDLTLPNGTTIQPDVIWVADDNTQTRLAETISGVPDLLVEVLSPSTRGTDKVDKFRLYENADVPEYWIIDPIAEFIEVWQNVDGAYQQHGIYKRDESFTSPVLNTQINTAALFED